MAIVGLNLGTNAFKAVELEKTRTGMVLQKYGIYKNPKMHFDPGESSDVDEYASALEAFYLETGFSVRDTVVSLPERDVFVITIKVPHMTEKELKSSIQFEAEQYIPLPVNEVTLSYQILGVHPSEKDKMEVLLVAAKKDVIAKYVGVLKKAHLVPRGLEPETLSMSRSLADPPTSPHASIIVNISTANTLLVITYKGYARLTRSISIGGESLTRAVQQGLNLDYMQAEEYKKAYGLDQNQVEGKVAEVLRPIFDNVVGEIKKSEIFFTGHTPDVTIKKVIVSGGTALMPGLLLYLANSLDVEVELANPWKQVSFSSKLESQKEKLLGMGPLFAIPVGLALKGV